MSTITPESTPGLYSVGRTTGTKEDLNGLQFATACPPDVDPRTRLIAVCGIADVVENQASPTEDGWFFSDFYLFHCLFSRGPTPSQIWMTCEKPEDLVQKYGEYVHEDPKGERRVVLDKNMLPEIEQDGNLCVVPRNDLLERFLSTLREQSLLAKDENQHLLVLFFGNGDMRSSGVTLGGNKPNLKIEDVRRSLQPDTFTTLFMTSCYSGGWIVQPNVVAYKHLNATGIFGAGPETENRSWPVSPSLNRARVIANAILQSTSSIAIEEPQAIIEVHYDPAYVSFVHSIYNLYKRLDQFADEHKIHFSAQDDQWALHFERRSSLPLSQLGLRLESLRSLPKDEHGAGTSSFGTIRKTSNLKHVARIYLFHANPGPSHNATNIALHNKLFVLLKRNEKIQRSEA